HPRAVARVRGPTACHHLTGDRRRATTTAARGGMRQDVTRRATDPVGRTSRTPDALEDRARIALALCILVAGVPAVVLMWWHDAAHDPVVRWGYPPLLAFLVAYAWVLLRRVEIAGAFSRGAVVVAQMVWIGGF